MFDATDLSGTNGETGSRGISTSVSPLPDALAKLSKAPDFDGVYKRDGMYGSLRNASTTMNLLLLFLIGPMVGLFLAWRNLNR